MTSRERVRATFDGEPIDRIAHTEYYWTETLKRWRSQGLSSEDREEVQYLFDHDYVYFYFDPRFGFEERLLSEDEEYRIVYTADGETLKVPKDESDGILISDAGGIPLEYTIKGRKEWEAHKSRYRSGEWRLYTDYPLSGQWLGGNKSLEDYRKKYQRAVEASKFKCLVFREPFEAVREFVGTDHMLLLMAEDPDLVREMMSQSAQVILEMIDLVDSLGMQMDGYWIWGDIAWKRGLLFSPAMYRELLMPVHRAILDRTGGYTIYHTDGNLDQCLPLLVEAGAKGINPIEIKAGNDFGRIAREYGDQLVLCGGIDTAVIVSNDLDRIASEIRTKLGLVKGRKYVFHSDHSIPYDVHLDTYRFVMQLVREYGAQ